MLNATGFGGVTYATQQRALVHFGMKATCGIEKLILPDHLASVRTERVSGQPKRGVGNPMGVEGDVCFPARVVDVFVDIPSVKRGIGGEPFWSPTHPRRGLRDQRKEIATIVLLECARFFSDHKFTIRGVAGDGNASPVAPEIFLLFRFRWSR